ncbi:MAG: amino acid adenylation domain-containing protein [Pseudomonadota bacterium]
MNEGGSVARDEPVADPATGAGERAAAEALLERLAAQKITLGLDGDRLRVSAPKGALDAGLRAEIAGQKSAIIAALTAGWRPAEPTARPIAARAPAMAPVPRASRTPPLPLSAAQQRLWFLNQLDGGSSAYTVGGATKLLGPLRPDLLQAAFRKLTQRHEALRMRFGERDGMAWAEIADDMAPEDEVVDLSRLPPAEREAEAARIIRERMLRPFDLANGPLMSMHLMRLSETEHWLISRIHHIVADGWSAAVASLEATEIYDALLEGRAPRLGPVRAHAVDHAAWERERAASPEWIDAIAFWQKRLAGAPPVIELPSDRPRPAQQSYRGARFKAELDADLVTRIKAAAQAQGATPYMVLLAAFQVLLHRHSGQDDIVVGSPVANRNRSEFENTIGCLINNVVIRADLAEDPSFAAFLAQVKARSLEAMEHGEPPFDMVVDALKPERTASHAPIFQVLFTLMSFSDTERHPKGCTVEPIEVETGATRFDLILELADFRGALRAVYEFATDLFDPETVERLHARFEALLRAAVETPEAPVSALDMLAPADRAALAEEAAPARVLEASLALTDAQIDRVAAAEPGRIAAVAADGAMDYATLTARATALAEALVAAGVGPGDRVAVCLERGLALPVALLAVWKAGAAYVPIDPAHPQERIAHILEDAAPAAAIAGEATRERLGAACPVIAPDAAASAEVRLPTARSLSDLAYLIYTSGSTGRPKGVEVEHGNLAAFLAAMRAEPGLTRDDVLVSVTTLSFDIAGLELWLPLSTGARVVIAERAETLDGHALAGLIAREGASVMQATPATWRLLLETGWPGAPRLRALCGGEAMPRALAEALLPRVAALWNMYGPTETTIWSTVARIGEAADAASIGQPIAGTAVHILDAAGRPVPQGAVGELCISGAGVARGYRNRAELTAERFATVDLPGAGPTRLYRTGDRARRYRDGRIAYLGRSDFQVKIRGFRIELGEIEAALGACAGVADCVVNPVEQAGERILVGYVVPRAEGFSAEAARAALRAALPDYMVPTRFLELDALPLTPNRKVDRKALPAPAPEPVAEARADEALMSPEEKKVARIWRELLGLSRVSVHDNFFDVGGHSMLLVRLHERLKSELGATSALVELFQRTTIAQQAADLGRGAAAGASAAVLKARRRAERLADV